MPQLARELGVSQQSLRTGRGKSTSTRARTAAVVILVYNPKSRTFKRWKPERQMTTTRISEMSIHVVSSSWLNSPEEGRALFEILEEVAPELMPERFGTSEPLRGVLEPGRSDEILEHWGKRAFFWSARRGAIDGSARPRYFEYQPFSVIEISMPPSVVLADRLVALLERLSTRLDAAFGIVHPLSPHDRERGYDAEYVDVEYLDRESDYLTIVSPDLEKCVPGLFWCTIFGPDYVELFGKDAFEALDVHEVRPVGERMMLLRFSDDPRSIVDDFDQFEKARRRAKAVLLDDAFFDSARGTDGRYTTPWGEPDLPSSEPLTSAEPPALAPGQKLIGPGGDVWRVHRVIGDNTSVRREKDDLPLMIGQIENLIDSGAFRLVD